MKKTHIALLFVLYLWACQLKKSENPEKSTIAQKDTLLKSTSNTEETLFEENEGFSSEDDVDFMPPIEDQSYLGIEIGKPITDYPDLLHLGILKTGEGEFPVHYIRYHKDTLGYIFGKRMIETIHIWDNRGATNTGVRVGTNFGELKAFLGQPEVHGSEMESRVQVFHKKHRYLLDYHSMEYELDFLKIPDSVVVKEIIIIN
mgnify:FL=1